MYDPLSLYRLATLRHQELLADAEKSRRLGKRASRVDVQATRKHNAFANWLEDLRERRKAQRGTG